MAVITRWRVARKPRRCTFCGNVIKPGQRYAAFSLPPGDGEVGNEKWCHAAGHGADGLACEAYWDADPYTPLPELMAGLS